MMEPILLKPSGKDYLWGGERLKSEYGKDIDISPLAETWECSAHPDGPSYAANGQFQGQSLIEMIDNHPEWLGTKNTDGFPVLIKFIDAAKDLSVQVLNMNPIKYTEQAHRVVRYYYGCSRELLCRCKYFETERINVTKGFSFSVLSTSFQVLLCIDGEGGLETDGSNKPLRFKKGSCIFLPADLGRCHVIVECELLKIRC